MDEQRKQFIEIETTPCKGAAMIAKNYSNGFKMIHKLDEIVAGCEGLTPILKEFLL